MTRIEVHIERLLIEPGARLDPAAVGRAVAAALSGNRAGLAERADVAPAIASAVAAATSGRAGK